MMFDFEDVLKRSLSYGFFNNDNELQYIVKQIMCCVPKLKYDIMNDGGGKNWVEFYNEKCRLVILLHTYYRIAFVRSDIFIKIADLYCVNVNSFNTYEWLISDIDSFNNKFPHMVWDEPANDEDYREFSLLDMRFATE